METALFGIEEVAKRARLRRAGIREGIQLEAWIDAENMPVCSQSVGSLLYAKRVARAVPDTIWRLVYVMWNSSWVLISNRPISSSMVDAIRTAHIV
jgi:hypothetical protein